MRGWWWCAVLGEILVFGPGAGSAASAGMTEMGRGCDGRWGRERRWVAGCNGGAVHGEIPAASAGMTEMGRGYDGDGGAGMAEMVGRA